jgi:hypothetical protein
MLKRAPLEQTAINGEISGTALKSNVHLLEAKAAAWT